MNAASMNRLLSIPRHLTVTDMAQTPTHGVASSTNQMPY